MGGTGGALVVFVTAPDAEADRIARLLVDARLAACVNVVPHVRSYYRWEGKTASDAEAQMIIKTSSERFDALCAMVREVHPYKVPEILALPVESGSAPYLSWIRECVAEGETPT